VICIIPKSCEESVDLSNSYRRTRTEARRSGSLWNTPWFHGTQFRNHWAWLMLLRRGYMGGILKIAKGLTTSLYRSKLSLQSVNRRCHSHWLKSPYTLCVSLLFMQTIRSLDWTLSHLTTFLSSHFVTCHMSLSHLFLTNSFACLGLNKWKSCALLIALDRWFLALVFAVGVLQLGLTVVFYFYVSLTTLFLLRTLFPFGTVSNKTPQSVVLWWP
jgi:hypothetical protein